MQEDYELELALDIALLGVFTDVVLGSLDESY
jgi:hypothetical protein